MSPEAPDGSEEPGAAIAVQKEVVECMAGRDVGTLRFADAQAQLARFTAAKNAKEPPTRHQ